MPPGLEMVADPHAIKPRLFRLNRKIEQLPGTKLLGGRLISQFQGMYLCHKSSFNAYLKTAVCHCALVVRACRIRMVGLEPGYTLSICQKQHAGQAEPLWSQAELRGFLRLLETKTGECGQQAGQDEHTQHTGNASGGR